MSTLERRVASVIRQHVDASAFWAGHWFDYDTNAFLICRSHEDGEKLFGKSVDSERLEDIQRGTRDLLKELRDLDLSTSLSISAKMRKPAIAAMLAGLPVKRPPSEAINALLELEEWTTWVRAQWGMREKASKKLNWKAASVTHTARTVWGRSIFFADQSQRLVDTDSATGLEYFHEFSYLSPPRYERDPPGPFGRFLEDIFEAVGVSSEVKRVSAASGLRSWREACLQTTRR